MNKTTWLDWLLYFGSKDERHRQAADRGGHLAFWIAFAAATVDFFVRVDLGLSAEQDLWSRLQPVLVDLVIILGAGAWYTWVWVSQGITLADSSRQRRMLKLLAWIAALGTAGVFVVKFWGQWTVTHVLTTAIGAAVAFLLCRLTYWWMDRAARRRAERGAQGPEKPVL